MSDIMHQLLPILIPCVVIAFAFAMVALLDLRKQTSTRGPKFVWAIFICVTWVIGPLAYFMIGRKEE